MPNTCENCTHWKPLAARTTALAPAINAGECRCNPPIESHRWPRTTGGEYCSCHSANEARFAQVQGATSEIAPAALADTLKREKQRRRGQQPEQLPIG